MPEYRPARPATRAEDGAVSRADKLARLLGKGISVLLLRRAPAQWLAKANGRHQVVQQLNRGLHDFWGRVVAGDNADQWAVRAIVSMSKNHRKVPSKRMYSRMPPACTMRATKGSSGSD